MTLGTICGCISSIYLPSLLSVPWDILATMKGIDHLNYLQTGVGAIVLTCLFLLPAFYTAAKKCQKRIQDGFISKKDGWGSFFIIVLLYFLGGWAFTSAGLFFGSPVMELRRMMVPYGS